MNALILKTCFFYVFFVCCVQIKYTLEMFDIFIHVFICFLLYSSFFSHLAGDFQCYGYGTMGTGWKWCNGKKIASKIRGLFPFLIIFCLSILLKLVIFQASWGKIKTLVAFRCFCFCFSNAELGQFVCPSQNVPNLFGYVLENNCFAQENKKQLARQCIWNKSVFVKAN